MIEWSTTWGVERMFGGLRSGRLAIVFFGTMGVVSGVSDTADVLWSELCTLSSFCRVIQEFAVKGEADGL
jgi:hypothetical protein